MVPVGERPILWHIMKTLRPFRAQRFHSVPWLQGPKVIKGLFSQLPLETPSDVTLGLGRAALKSNITINTDEERLDLWTLVDTGQATMDRRTF